MVGIWQVTSQVARCTGVVVLQEVAVAVASNVTRWPSTQSGIVKSPTTEISAFGCTVCVVVAVPTVTVMSSGSVEQFFAVPVTLTLVPGQAAVGLQSART